MADRPSTLTRQLVRALDARESRRRHAGHDAIYVGDAFVTRNVITGTTGPQLFPNFNTDNEQAFASLARFERVEGRLVLAGHGDPWDRGLTEAVQVARENSAVSRRAGVGTLVVR